MDMKRPRAFVYRKGKDGEVESKMVYCEDQEGYLKDGWLDSPATLINFKEKGISLENEIEVQAIGETIEDVKNIVNASLNLDLMSPKELSEFAKEKFGKDIRYIGVKKEKIIRQVKDLIEG